MTDKIDLPASNTLDVLRQALIVITAPLIWLFSSLGFFLSHARSPSDFSDLSVNILVPQTFAFSIWLPIFIGIFAYSIVQALPANRARLAFRQSGWWMVAGLGGVALWGLVTAFAPNSSVEVLASLVFIPAMLSLVIAMIKVWQHKADLKPHENWLVLIPVSLIAGWCSIAIFVGFNGLIWKTVEPIGWSITGTALSVLGLALWWVIYVLRQQAMNSAYAFPVVWGLGCLAVRHFAEGGDIWIGSAAIIGSIAAILAALIKHRPNPTAS